MTIAGKKPANRVDTLSTHNGFSLISDEKLLQLYSTMLKCRMLEERARALGKHGVVNTRSITGEIRDAAVAGVTTSLLPTDTLAPSHGALIPCFAKGLPLMAVFSALLGHRTAFRPSYASLNVIPPSRTLVTQLDHTLRIAATYKARKNKRVAVVFCGDGAVSSSSVESALARAGSKNLPILFVCRSNHDGDDLLLKAQECGFPGVAVDGDDAVAIYRVATEAIAHARCGSGPTLIECKPWPHVGRPSSKRQSGGKAIVNMETYLTRKGLFTKKLKAEATTSFRRELDAALKAAGV